MKTHFNNNTHAKKVVILQQQSFYMYTPPIPFVVLEKKSMKMDNDDKDKSNHKKINMPLDHTNANAGSIEWKVQVFEKGNLEDCIKWKLCYEELEMAMSLDLALKRLNMVQNLLHREAKNIFDTAHSTSPIMSLLITR